MFLKIYSIRTVTHIRQNLVTNIMSQTETWTDGGGLHTWLSYLLRIEWRSEEKEESGEKHWSEEGKVTEYKGKEKIKEENESCEDNVMNRERTRVTAQQKDKRR